MNIANLLTTIRFFLVPIVGWLLYNNQNIWAIVVLVLSGLTDIFDGFFARKFNTVTSWGKLADPLADKLMQIMVLVMLFIKDKISIVIVIILILKEVFMVIGSYFLYKEDNVVVSANWYGKIATVLIYFAVVLIIFNVPYASIIMILAVAFSLFSLLMYTLNFLKLKSQTNK